MPHPRGRVSHLALPGLCRQCCGDDLLAGAACGMAAAGTFCADRLEASWRLLCGHFAGLCPTCAQRAMALCTRALSPWPRTRRVWENRDVFQELFTRLLKHAWQPEQGPLGAWCHLLVRCIVLGQAVRQAGPAVGESDLGGEGPGPLDGADPAGLSPERLAELRDFRRWVILELEQMPRRLREAATLSLIEGYTGSQIAEELEVSPGTVSRRVREAMRLLMRRLGRQAHDPTDEADDEPTPGPDDRPGSTPRREVRHD